MGLRRPCRGLADQQHHHTRRYAVRLHRLGQSLHARELARADQVKDYLISSAGSVGGTPTSIRSFSRHRGRSARRRGRCPRPATSIWTRAVGSSICRGKPTSSSVRAFHVLNRAFATRRERLALHLNPEGRTNLNGSLKQRPRHFGAALRLGRPSAGRPKDGSDLDFH